jgi:hypothetical protein
MLRKLIGTVLLGGALIVGTGAAANATTPATLKVETSDTGSVTVQHNSVDSPVDKDSTRIKLALAEQTGDDWAILAPKGSTGIRGPLTTIRHLQFDVKTTNYVGAGAPRISVDVDTNHDGKADLEAYLSAAYCQKTLANGWAAASFKRTTAGCSFYDSNSVQYSSDGTTSAWAQFAAAHPGATITDAYIVMDEVGQSFIDRIGIGSTIWTNGLAG